MSATYPTATGTTSPDLTKMDPIQMGFWVPNRVWATANYVVPLFREIEDRRRSGTLPALAPPVAELKAWVTRHAVYRMEVTAMIDQANAYIVSQLILGDCAELEDIRTKDGDILIIFGFDALFDALSRIITTSPGFNDTEMVGTPMNGLLAVSMATEAGTALFHDATFNQQFKKVLDAWNAFLKSGDSLDKLDIHDPEKPGSWISKAAHAAGVWKEMVHDPRQPGYGYDCWNAFFIRQFVEGARPFHGDAHDVVNIGCETTPWEYQDELRREAKFWIKDMPYSLLDLFGGRGDLADLFEGGQAYQGFLSATHYHRWRAPLTGEIVRSWVEPGTYFAQRPQQGQDQGTWEGTASQPYLGHVAARAVFVFKHENEAFGYVAMICIGMVEVSTCVIEPSCVVGVGDPPVAIARNTGIGHFEFGGSTHMMIFQKDRAKLVDWAVKAVAHRNDTEPTHMGSIIAHAPGGEG